MKALGWFVLAAVAGVLVAVLSFSIAMYRTYRRLDHHG